MPPLGLLTIAAMIPAEIELKLVDMNVEPLTEADLYSADAVFVSAMSVQNVSFAAVINRCQKAGKIVVSGGPYVSAYWQNLADEPDLIMVLGEAEGGVVQQVIADLRNDKAQKIYQAPETKPDLGQSPLPRYDLIRLTLRYYATMALQFCRGCPGGCEFCDITLLFGNKTRTKTTQQIIAELDQLYNLGWRGSIFWVDDNFIGNRTKATEVLIEVVKWQKEHNYPFMFFTEASVDLGTLDDLLKLMVDAGFYMVFLGIETPNPEALKTAHKTQNVRVNLLETVRKIQSYGIQVIAGFVLGLDGDDLTSFRAIIDFVQKAAIPSAMVGLLQILVNTKLYMRLKEEGRLRQTSYGDIQSTIIGYQPKSMSPEELLQGFAYVLKELYGADYFKRCLEMLRRTPMVRHRKRKLSWREIYALFQSLGLQILSRRRIGWREIGALLQSLELQLFAPTGRAYARLLLSILWENPKWFPEAVRMAIVGYHLQIMTAQICTDIGDQLAKMANAETD